MEGSRYDESTPANSRLSTSKQALHIRLKRLKNAKDESEIRRLTDELHDWLASDPDVPHGKWYKRFRRFTLAGEGDLPKTFLEPGHGQEGARWLNPARRR